MYLVRRVNSGSITPGCGHGIPPGADQILGLHLASPHLTLLRALTDLRDKRLLLPFEFDSLLVQLSDGFVEKPLVLSQTLCWRHALAECPFQDLRRG
jgi:hypothetical protein